MQKVRYTCRETENTPECLTASKDQPSLCQAHRNLRDIKKYYYFLMDHEIQGTRKQKHLGLHRQLGCPRVSTWPDTTAMLHLNTCTGALAGPCHLPGCGPAEGNCLICRQARAMGFAPPGSPRHPGKPVPKGMWQQRLRSQDTDSP